MKPILFNTEMVKAILDGRKTQTRRVVGDKLLNEIYKNDCYIDDGQIFESCMCQGMPDGSGGLEVDRWEEDVTTTYSKYKVGDILFVQEDWKIGGWNNTSFAFDHSCEPFDKSWHTPPGKEHFYDLLRNTLNELEAMKYPNNNGEYKWEKFKSPLKMMDKSTMQYWMARIFLKVTNVRVERLQDIKYSDIEKELGVNADNYKQYTSWSDLMACDFKDTWNSTSKDGYKWEDNPYVFLYEFERVTKES